MDRIDWNEELSAFNEKLCKAGLCYIEEICFKVLFKVMKAICSV
jgi:hypothetical protein